MLWGDNPLGSVRSDDPFVQSSADLARYCVRMRLILACALTGVQAAAQDIAVPITPDRWTTQQLYARDKISDTARFETYLGRPSLLVPSGFAFARDVDLRSGTLEADLATYDRARFFGLAFHVASPPDQYEIVFFRPPGADPTLQYTPSFTHMNAWQLFPYPDYATSVPFPQQQWVHVRIVIKGLVASIFVDTATTPSLEVHDLALGSVGGTIGFWGRNGGAYLSNVHYRPDPATYTLTPERAFVPGAITEGWSLSQAFLVSDVDPATYPDVRALAWQPVRAEREGIVVIGRYRRDPNVEGERPLRDGPARMTAGTQVVFARNTIVSDRDVIRKMWVGYSDDIVVYLNGRPLYAGRNSMVYRDPFSLGYLYPYADAIFLPLRKGKNELVLAVSEATAGWGFMTRFDPPSLSGAP